MASSNASRFSRPRGFLCGCPDAVGARDPAPCKPHVEKPEWRTHANSSSLRGAKVLPLHSAHGTGCPLEPQPQDVPPCAPCVHFICIAFSRRKTRAKLRRARSGEFAARNSMSGEGAPVVIRPGRDLQIRARVRDVLHQFLGARRQPPSSSRRKASSAGMVCNSLR